MKLRCACPTDASSKARILRPTCTPIWRSFASRAPARCRPLDLGDSDKLKIGDWVIAIGNPFGFEQTVSSGIISGVGRELGSSASRARFLQTDAAINPGNSGGPLINLRGEVIGINTAIASNNGSFNGLGFAIPVNVAKWVTSQLIDKGSVQRAYLGVSLEDELNPELAERFGTHHGQGALVTQVIPKTPAAEAGFEPGDVITKFAGHPVKDRSDLQSVVERVTVDTAQEVEIVRDGKTQTLHVTPKAMPKEFGTAERRMRGGRTAPNDPSSFEAEEIGIEVADLTPERAESLGLENATGVVVTKVDADKVGGRRRSSPGNADLESRQDERSRTPRNSKRR